MSYGDIRDEWRINDVERKAEQAVSRLHELDALYRTVDSLEHSLREACAKIDGLCNELSTAQSALIQIQEVIAERLSKEAR